MSDDDHELLPPPKDPSAKQAYGLRQEGVPAPNGVDPATLRGPGRAAQFPAGSRAVPPAGGHWFSTGPGNLGGRVPALAIDPSPAAAGKVLYAGAASGGIFKTTDGGEHWDPKWRDQPSLSIAAIAVAPSRPQTVYVATGEPGATPSTTGAGIFRSDDGGDTWTRIATAESLSRSFFFEALAVHPDDESHLWAVGRRGVFRTLNGRDPTPSFQQFDVEDPVARTPPIYYSDALFARAAGVPGAPAVLYLCRGRTERGEIVRLDDPVAGEATIRADLANPDNRSLVFAAAGIAPAEARTLRGKITVSRDAPNVMYAAFAQVRASHINRPVSRELRAIMRCTNATVGGAHGFHAATWTDVPYRAGGSPSDFWQEDQGEYNLLIGVSPTNPDHLFFGMQNLYMTRNARAAAPTWHPVLPWELWRLDRAIHADQHAIVFEQHVTAPAVPAVWIGNDGGVVRSTDYATATAFISDAVVAVPPPLSVDFRSLTPAMLPATGGMHWQQRIHGLVATQAYDLTQSPLVPTMFACGHQDNGVWYTSGGDTWRRVLGADGGFIAWDPLDPYHLLATWQGALDTVQFSGGWDAAVPPPNVSIGTFLWPRELNQGFHRIDRSRFVADTIHHPRKVGRIVTTRNSRAYASSDGETFTPLPLGDQVELVATHQFPQPTIPDVTGARMRHNGMVMLEVVGGTASAKLGLYRGIALDSRNRTQNPAKVEPAPNPSRDNQPLGTNITTMRTLLRAPYALADGDTLELRLRIRDRAGNEQDVPGRTVTFHTADFASIGQATAPEVASAMTAALGMVFTSGLRKAHIEARSIFHGPSVSVELITTALGPVDPDPATPVPATPTLEIGGDAAVLAALGVSAGVYRGINGRPAMITLQTYRMDIQDVFAQAERDVSVPDGASLTIKVNGGPLRTLTFRASSFANLTSIRAHELARELQAVLDTSPAQPARAIAATCAKQVVVFRDDHVTAPDAPVVAASTALARMTEGNSPPGAAHLTPFGAELPEHELRFTPRTRFNAFNLAPPAPTPLKLRLAGAGGTTDIDFDAPPFVDRGRATVDEVVAKIRRTLPAARHLRCEVEMSVGWGEPTELAYGSDEPASLWVGGSAGALYLSPDDGVTWRFVGSPEMASQERSVEAITVDPRDPRVVYVGFGGTGNGGGDPGTLFKSVDQGRTWTAIGRADLVEVDSAGAPLSPSTPLGVNEVVIDPEDSRRLWVATTAGVFWSTDGGGKFLPFGEGLPNASVVDLTFVPGRRLLRCALWGRGTYARDVSATDPPAVQLYLRASILDDGAVRPADDGLDGFATSPAQASRWESPDIKISRGGYRDLGSNDDQLDAVEFDEDIVSEPIGQHGAAADAHALCVLVHNRSERPATSTRMIALWADCSRRIPDLPDTFWPTIGAPAPTVDSPWHSIGVAVLAGGITAGRPRAVRMGFTPPADIALTAEHIGVLVLVTSPDDTLPAGPRSVADLLATERRAGFRLVPTRTQRETAQLVLLATDKAAFTVTETPPGWLGLATPVAVTAQRGAPLASALDLSAAPVRRLVVTVPQPAPASPRVVDISFSVPELTALGADSTTVTPADLRRVINRALQLAPVGVRCVTQSVRLSVRADDQTADLIAREVAFPDLTAAGNALASGEWLTLGSLKRGVSNHIYARVRNDGGAPEPTATWRAYWFDPAGPITLDAAHQLATGAMVLAAGATAVVETTHTPGPGSASRRGIAIWLSSPGDPVRAPLAEPPAGAPPVFADAIELDAYCAAHPNVGYRMLELVS